MADEQPEASGHRASEDGRGSINRETAHHSIRIQESSSAPRQIPDATETANIRAPRRSATLREATLRHDEGSTTRARGHTMSSRSEFDGSRLGSRPPVPNIGAPHDERRPDGVTEEGRAGSEPRISSSMNRRRRSTVTGRPRGNTLTQQISIAYATGRDGQDAQSGFSLGGPVAEITLPANQPYIEPGYADLNPAYEQPLNTRPVWGLAKPLPRVIRPGMVPTASEVRQNTVNVGGNLRQDGRLTDADLERGRVEPTLKLSKVSSQLQEVRERRESRLLQRYGTRGSSVEPRPLTPHSEFPEEEAREDLDNTRLNEAPSNVRPEDTRNSEAVDENTSTAFPRLEDTASTIHEDFKDDLDDWYNDELMPMNAHGAEIEVHNHHTHWSIIRTRYREPLAELVAVTVQLTLGFCSDLAIVTSNSAAGNEATADWAWGLATMVGIYIAGGISGAHLNPAISIMLWIFRGFPLGKVPSYFFAQVLGAFLAALISYGLYRSDIIQYGGVDLAAGATANAFITNPRYEWINPQTAFFNEFTATAFLAIAVLALGDDTNAPPGAGMNAFIVGLVITVLSMAFGYNTGAALNPSRDFGPRLALLALGYGGQLFQNGWWVYGPWVATITGAIFGAAVYDTAIFVGGESPVNYPRRRIKRAGKKWKSRMGRRWRKVKRKVVPAGGDGEK